MGASTPRPVLVTALVAVVVAVVAFGAVALLRWQRADSDQADKVGPPVSSNVDAAAQCGAQPCEVLTSQPIGSTRVELLADVDGHNGRLRVWDGGSNDVLRTALADMNVKVTQKSLTCMQGPPRACMVRGRHERGVVGEVFVAKQGAWEAAEQPYFSNAGFVDLLDVKGDRSPAIGVAKQQCDDGDSCDGPVVVQAYELGGRCIGRSPEYTSLTYLPGWPDVDLRAADLSKC